MKQRMTQKLFIETMNMATRPTSLRWYKRFFCPHAFLQLILLFFLPKNSYKYFTRSGVKNFLTLNKNKL